MPTVQRCQYCQAIIRVKGTGKGRVGYQCPRCGGFSRLEPTAGTITKVKGGFRITQTIDPLTGQPWEPGEGPQK